jgi:ribosome maturation factor RimP
VGSTHSFFWGAELESTEAADVIRSVATRVAQSRRLELIDVVVGRGFRFVRLIVDRPGGIGLAEIQAMSEEVSTILDVEDPIDAAYTLEVSSPGLDRPLRTEADFERCFGQRVGVTTQEPFEDGRQIRGRIESVSSGVIALKLEDGEIVTLPLESVAHARREIEFPKGGAPRTKKRHKKDKR